MHQYRLKRSVFYHHIDAALLALLQPPYSSKENCQLHFIRNQKNSVICKEARTLQYIDTALPTTMGNACFQLIGHENITLSKVQDYSNKLRNAYSSLALIMNLKKLRSILCNDGSRYIISQKPVEILSADLLNQTIVHIHYNEKNSSSHEITVSINL